jgi:hypothetical protein
LDPYKAPLRRGQVSWTSTRSEVNTNRDAALHGYLHQMTARARWLMEVALEKLAEVEGIPLAEDAVAGGQQN